jgi:hypothetical protein
MIRKFFGPNSRYDNDRIAVLLGDNSNATEAIIQRVDETACFIVNVSDSAFLEGPFYRRYAD